MDNADDEAGEEIGERTEMDTLAQVFADVWDKILSVSQSAWDGLVRVIWYKRWVGWTLLCVVTMAMVIMTVLAWVR